VAFEDIVCDRDYRSEQNGFWWVFRVLGIGPTRIRVRQSSTAGGFSPRVRLLTQEQWEAFLPSLCEDAE